MVCSPNLDRSFCPRELSSHASEAAYQFHKVDVDGEIRVLVEVLDGWGLNIVPATLYNETRRIDSQQVVVLHATEAPGQDLWGGYN